MHRCCLVIVLTIAAAIPSGCGSSHAPSAQSKPPESPIARQVRTTVQEWLGSLDTPKQRGDDARACGYLTHVLQQSIDQQLRMRSERATCRSYAAKWTGRSNPPGRAGAHVTGVAVTGGTATATIKAPPDRESQVQLQRVGRRWLINNY